MQTREEKAAARQRWKEANREKVRACNAAWAAANPEQVKASRAKWRLANADKKKAWETANADKMNAYSLAWAKRNKHVKAAQRSLRRARELQRTPAWADKEKIDDLFVIARAATELFDEPFEVDHILPLVGKRVSGLHVHTNLQVLRESENRKKHNRFQVEFQKETRDLATAA